MSESVSSKSKKVQKHRSPAYPSTDLKTAIDRARTFYHYEKRSAANVDVAVQHWGYKASSGAGKQILAALISYALLESNGNGANRTVRLTELALNILLDDRPESVERAEAVRKSALKPKIHAEVFTKWSTELPSTPNLRHYLLIDKKFNENSVDDFISQLRTTFDFAKIYSSPTFTQSVPAVNVIAGLDKGSDLDDLNHIDLLTTPDFANGTAPTDPSDLRDVAAVAKRMRQDALSLDEGQVVLQWPDHLSETSFQDLSEWLELMLRRTKRNLSNG